MAKRRRDTWFCDAPGCEYTELADVDAPSGFSGKVSTVGGSGVVNEPWYACKTEHITPAISWVVKVTHERVWSAR